MQTLELIELMGPPAVAERLVMARPSALQLIEAGVIGPRYTDGQRLMVERDRVEALAERPTKNLDELPPALVLRVGPPQEDPDDDSRDWLGWRGQEASNDKRRAGVSRWWRVHEADRLAGQLFVVTVSGFVVDVARIDGASSDGSRWAFRLSDPEADDTDVEPWRAVRLRATAGGAVIRHRLD
jgi:hypothetical protein